MAIVQKRALQEDGYYRDGKCIKDIKHIYEKTSEIEALLKTVHAPHLELAECFHAVIDCTNNEILYIKAEKQSRHHLGEYTDVFYEMEFLHGKEYNGTFRFHDISDKDHYTIVDGKLDGGYCIGDKKGHYHDGKFSGTEETVETDTPLGSYINDIKNHTNKWITEDKGLRKALKEYSNDEVVGYKIETPKGVYDIPLNGHVHIENYDTVIDCDIKDGKLDGLYKSEGEQSLAGNCSFEKECNFKNGILDGDYKETKESIKHHPYYREEITYIKGTYSNGKKNGFWKTYADNGDLIEIRRFENGKDVTEHYEKLKKIAAKQIDREKETGKMPKKISSVEKSSCRDECR